MAVCLGSQKVVIKVQGTMALSGGWGVEIYFLAYSHLDGWQNSVSCGYKTEILVLLLPVC